MTAIQFWTGPSIIFIHQPHPHSISPQGLMQGSFWEPPNPPPSSPKQGGQKGHRCLMDRSGSLHYQLLILWACMTMTELYQHVFQLDDIILEGKKKIKNEQGSHSLVPNCLSYKHCWLQFITRAMANTQAGITKSWNAKELKILHVIHSVQMVFRKKSRGPVWKWNQILDFQNPFLTDFHWD